MCDFQVFHKPPKPPATVRLEEAPKTIMGKQSSQGQRSDFEEDSNACLHKTDLLSISSARLDSLATVRHELSCSRMPPIFLMCIKTYPSSTNSLSQVLKEIFLWDPKKMLYTRGFEALLCLESNN